MLISSFILVVSASLVLLDYITVVLHNQSINQSIKIYFSAASFSDKLHAPGTRVNYNYSVSQWDKCRLQISFKSRFENAN